MLFFDRLSSDLQKQVAINVTRGQRHLIFLNGDIHWALTYLKNIEPLTPFLCEGKSLDNNVLIYSDSALLPVNVTTQNYRHKLGSQSQFVIYKDESLHLDVLCALAGTLVAGGVLFIVVDKADEYKGFKQRLLHKIDNAAFIWSIEQGSSSEHGPHIHLDGVSEIDSDSSASQTTMVTLPYQARTQEQSQAVLAILNVAQGHRNRPLVLTADRGRGKSSALALACAELLKSDAMAQNIVVCAPHRNSLNVFFAQLLTSLENHSPVLKGNIFKSANSSVQYIPVDELLKTKTDARLILIDEAASIPVYLLTALAKKYSRLVFASTVHGYEGAGRGFGVIFKKALESISPYRQMLHIKEPIRWSSQDPLERFISDLCLLDAKLPKLKQALIPRLEQRTFDNTSGYSLQRLSGEALMNNEALLHDVFAILVTAHYQTSPNDLKLLLENNKVHTLVLSDDKQIIAVALLMEEGGDIDCSVRDIYEGKRRVKDQFLPQSLLSHLGIQESFQYRYHRILRIAVHPEIQSQGVGTYFMANIIDYSQQSGADFIGSSFGLAPQLLNFWLKAGFAITRIGFSKDKASGEYSIMVMKGLSAKSEVLANTLLNGFYQEFNYLLSDEYSDLSPEIVSQILSFSTKEGLPVLSASDMQAVQDFALSYRQYSCCVFGLHRWLLQHLSQTQFNNKSHQASVYPLIMRVFQKHSIDNTCQTLGLSGKKALQNHMIEYVKEHSAS